MIIYRIIGFFINLIGLLIAVSLLVIVPMFIVVPILWLPMFLIIAVVLYTWFSSRFRKKVLVKEEMVPRSLRDWIKVNGYVAIVFTFINIPPVITLIRNPATYLEATKEFTKQLGQNMQQGFKQETLHTISYVMLVYLIALLVHVLWTFALVRKHEEHFE